MRYSKAHKEETRSAILEAALHTFRMEGYNGIGIDGIAKAAGVTSGAFYKHFSSKSEAFRSVISEGLSMLREAIVVNQRLNGTNWLNTFVKWYFSFPKKGLTDSGCSTLPMEGGCALPALSAEISRTDPETQQLFEKEVSKIVKAISSGLPDSLKQKNRLSWTVLVLMVGGVALARSVRNEKIAAEIANSVIATIKQLTK